MKLEQIKINSYKSIRHQITIDIHNNMVVFLGKNGSGKSNILQALNTIFSHEKNLSFQQTEFSFELMLSLNRKEIKEIYNQVPYDDAHRTLVLKNDRKLSDQVLIQSDTFTEYIRSKQSELVTVSSDLRMRLSSFQKELSELIPEVEFTSKNAFRLINVDQVTNDLLQNIARIEGQLITMVKEKLVDHHYVISPLSQEPSVTLPPLTFPKIEVRPIQLSKLELQYVVIDLEGLTKQVNAINSKMEQQGEEIRTLLEKMNEIYRKVMYLLRSVDDILVEREGFNSAMMEILNRHCYFITSDGNSLFPKKGESNKSSNSVIFQSLATSCYEKTRNPLFKRALQEDVTSFSMEELRWMAGEFQEVMNVDTPTFELDMMEGYEVSVDDDRQFHLFVKEQGGAKTLFEQTSSGRRWYYTYYFLRRQVKPKDYLILDEPGVFLHPTAQKELLEDLTRLAASGVMVFYSTHSPYLISERVESIKIVELTSQGTEIQDMRFDPQGFNAMCDRIGYIASQDFLLNFQWNHVLVEGEFDRIYMDAMCHYFKIQKMVHFIPGAGDNIKNLVPVFEQMGLNFIVILDGDKAEKEWVKDYIKKGKRIYLLPVDYIEHMLVGDDQIRYRGRLTSDDKREIAKDFRERVYKNQLDPKTIENFRELFQKIGLIKSKH